ncbi:ribonuclease Y [Candidatus Daviesbacteria bacterium RIFCSPHIGHO2_02_FULL_41_10]|uniref:Ribonuclease Y n=2 Tax=Candidatus Daviesiibacteriota TaxID=1752718 RepID=A0A1F5IRT4_9BACT|nr:MAG: ribonuclease Y [Candidatus Daviesbacteria bacterium RIFCSPHIGHO2_01_FULL_41_23]OGE33751.1 MAG: ribonuclease Y [Candidatus Daviesbacteria bacterium RIFCSPHIGHO2_02_FULL_41_10]OGE62159.1 MAG: ribonuclease Y [Candidatus Daviesbacteria bacterium RIFCSPLOWO2_01_FULL_41_32]
MQRTFGPINSSAANAPQSNIDATELAKREGILEERERQIAEKQRLVDEKLEQLEKVRKDLVSKLEKVSSMSAGEAQKILLENVDKELASEISRKIKEAEEEIKLTADEKAKEIITDAMRHGVTDYVSEFTTSKVKLPDEEMKGRIIGKEGRNVRTFEQATGVDVVMDDEIPDTLILSSFDSIRREIARVALLRLMEDGRIQPQKIEEIVEKTKEDINKLMRAAGEKLCQDVGVYNLPVELVDIIGRFKYRYSYGQNLILHTQEETQIGIALARMVGADVNVVRLGCLLHDIGKVVNEDEEGTHVEKGAALAKKFGLPEKVVNCIAEHHEDQPFSAVESILVYIADAISGARPGARHENVGDYIKRLDDIEKIATSFEGVEKAFAVQAGREVRVIVSPERIPDDELPKLVHDIAERISKEVMVPGAVKITAIRETRYSESIMTTP